MQTKMLKDFLVYAIEGISMYAHRARRFALTDREIDLFVANTLSAALSDTPIDTNDVCRWVRQVAEVRDRASTLYTWACELFTRQPEVLTGPAQLDLSDDPRRVCEQAQTRSTDMGRKNRDQQYWEESSMHQLGRLATVAARSWGADLGCYDIYGFIHEALDCLTRDESLDVLMELHRRIKEANLKMANTLVNGDTLTDRPVSGFHTVNPAPHTA